MTMKWFMLAIGRMKVAWIVPKWPLPINDGARKATTQLVSHLCAQGMEIHLIAMVPKGEATNPAQVRKILGVESVAIFRRSQVLQGGRAMVSHLFRWVAHPFTPITLTPFRKKSLVSEIQRYLMEQSFDIVCFDGLHAAITCAGTKIYRAHNVESEIWRRAAAESRNIFKRLVLKFQAWLMEIWEKKTLGEVQHVFTVSERDRKILKILEPNAVISVLPIGLERVPVTQAPFSEKIELLFVGRLDWPPNRDGLTWFLLNVWPRVCDAASLTIVGSGEGGWLSRFSNLKSVRILGHVKDLSHFYNRCNATINPIFYGGGTRVKAIESSVFGRPCISTKLGMEGIGLEPGTEFVEVESVDQWVSAIQGLEVEDAQAMGLRAHASIGLRFDPHAIARRFIIAVSQ